MPGAIIRRARKVVDLGDAIASEFVIRPFPRATDEVEAVAVFKAGWSTFGVRGLVELHRCDRVALGRGVAGADGGRDLHGEAGGVDGGGVDEVACWSGAPAGWRQGEVDAEAVEHAVEGLRAPR